MLTPRVSVVLAVRDGEPFIEESVRSILRQSFRDFELIVVDDGSADRTPAILERLRREDSRVQIVSQQNHGLTASLMTGVGLARGAYIARQDADDISMPTRFERQVEYLDAHLSVAALGTGADVLDESGATVGRLPAACGPGAVRRGLMTLRATPVHGSVMLRRSALEAIGGYREAFRVCQDYDLWLRLVSRFVIDNLPDVLYQWRLGRDGVYASRRAMQLRSAGLALAFAHERAAEGRDSYESFRACDGDLDRFVADYRLRAFVYATWGELLLRGLGNSTIVRSYFRRAVRMGNLLPRTLVLLGWTHLGLPWPGGRPLAPRSPGVAQ